MLAGAIVALLALTAYLLVPTVPAPLPVAAPRSSRPSGTARVASPPASEVPAPPVLAAPSRFPSLAAQASASNAVRRAAAVGILSASSGSTASSSGPAPPSSGPPTSRVASERASRGLTSIPGAYLQAADAQHDPALDWDTIAPPVAAPLPFAAGFQRDAPGLRAAGGAPETPRDSVLEMELARLRARVRELEVRRPAVLSGVSARRGASSAAAAAPRAPEPPAPPAQVAVVGPRGCAGCGEALATSQPPPLCWGCGRALCPNCYWRFGPGPGLHRCPECLSRSPSVTTGISGGRAARATMTTPATGAATNPISPPASR